VSGSWPHGRPFIFAKERRLHGAKDVQEAECGVNKQEVWAVLRRTAVLNGPRKRGTQIIYNHLCSTSASAHACRNPVRAAKEKHCQECEGRWHDKESLMKRVTCTSTPQSSASSII
jgi:DnaJ-class molecular chaperone